MSYCRKCEPEWRCEHVCVRCGKHGNGCRCENPLPIAVKMVLVCPRCDECVDDCECQVDALLDTSRGPVPKGEFLSRLSEWMGDDPDARWGLLGFDKTDEVAIRRGKYELTGHSRITLHLTLDKVFD